AVLDGLVPGRLGTAAPCATRGRVMRRLTSACVAAAAMMFTATVADAAVIYVTTTVDKVSSTGGCSLKEAVYAANFDASLAVDQVLPNGVEHYITTSCTPGAGNDTIVLPNGATFVLTRIADDLHNTSGPTAMPIVFSTIQIEANGSTLRWAGTFARAFTV